MAYKKVALALVMVYASAEYAVPQFIKLDQKTYDKYVKLIREGASKDTEILIKDLFDSATVEWITEATLRYLLCRAAEKAARDGDIEQLRSHFLDSGHACFEFGGHESSFYCAQVLFAALGEPRSLVFLRQNPRLPKIVMGSIETINQDCETSEEYKAVMIEKLRLLQESTDQILKNN